MSTPFKHNFPFLNKQQSSKLRLLIWMLMLIGICPVLKAQIAPSLSSQAEIWVLTCSPGNEVWAHYGHTGIRVMDPVTARDIVFNYGIFDFNSHNFLWNFVRGEIDYILGTSSYAVFMHSYRFENRRVTAQKLHLSTEEKEKLWQALVLNSLPENRTYRYNFYYDNCSTRARKIIERSLDGNLHYPDEAAYSSMRQVIKHYTAKHPWTWFGISFALSSRADAEASYTDLLFAPELMMEAFEQATVTAPAQSGENSLMLTRNLVDQEQLLHEIDPNIPREKSGLPGPVLVCWFLFAMALTIGIHELKGAGPYPAADAIIFGLVGLAGLIITFLAFVSVHPVTKANYLLIWIQPLHLFFALAMIFPAFRQSKLYKGYLQLNLPVFLFALIGFTFLPQYVHPGMIPLLLTLISRSLLAWIHLFPKAVPNMSLSGTSSGKSARIL